MPELPEVETVARGLKFLSGQRLGELEILDAKVWFESEREASALAGLRLLEVSRRGKYILLRFEGGFTLAQHLRMTGKMLEANSRLVPAAVSENLARRAGKGLQVRCRFRFERAEIWFFDTRRFGTLTLVQNEENFFRSKKIAPDPILDPTRARDWFLARLAVSSKPAKAALLDQSIAAGVGNIYADEALFASGIHPRTPARKIRAPLALWENIQRILTRSIELGGSTIRDYVSAEGAEGAFAGEHKVYDRAGEPCRSCGVPVRRIVLAGRSTHFCPSCQPIRERGKSARSRAVRKRGSPLPRRPRKARRS